MNRQAAPAAEPAGDLKRPELYINRLLSLLAFNRRVLEQAKDPVSPLLERLKFLCISSTNLDEFFEIRVAGLKQRIELGVTQAGPDSYTPQEVMKAVADRAHSLVEEQYRVLNQVLTPELASEGIRFIRRTDWAEAQRRWLRRYFEEELAPILSPMGLDPPGAPLPPHPQQVAQLHRIAGGPGRLRA